jgi:hypothetical protein
LRFTRSLLTFVFLCASAFAADRNALTFTKYDLTVIMTPSSQGFDGKGTVTLRNDSNAPQKYAVLQVSSSLEWQHITIGSDEVQFLAQPYTTDIDHTGAVSEVTITLPKPLDPKQTIALNVEYSGTIAIDAKRLTRIGTPDQDALRSDWDQISDTFTGVRGLGFVAWYPVAMDAASLSDGNAVFSTMADWRRKQTGAEMHVNLCLPAKESGGRVILANGTESATKAESGCKTYDYRFDALTTPSFVIGSLQALQRPSLTVYHDEGHTTAAQDYAAEFERLAALSASWFGEPREHAVFVELTGRAAAPYETGALMFGPLGQGERLATDLSAAYQLAQVSTHSFRPWIDYGLAHFMQFLTMEHEAGRSGALRYLEQYSRPLATADKAPSDADTTSRSLINTDDELFYRAKALFAWSMLRDLVGDQALAAAIQDYRAQDDKDASYMQKLIKKESKKDLEWFFDDWVYRDRGLPDFHIVSVYPRQILGGQYLITVTVENLGKVAAEVPVLLQVEGGERTARVVVKPGEKAIARINTQQLPSEVVVNDGSVPESDLSNNSFKVVAPAAQ